MPLSHGCAIVFPGPVSRQRRRYVPFVGDYVSLAQAFPEFDRSTLAPSLLPKYRTGTSDRTNRGYGRKHPSCREQGDCVTARPKYLLRTIDTRTYMHPLGQNICCEQSTHVHHPLDGVLHPEPRLCTARYVAVYNRSTRTGNICALAAEPYSSSSTFFGCIPRRKQLAAWFHEHFRSPHQTSLACSTPNGKPFTLPAHDALRRVPRAHWVTASLLPGKRSAEHPTLDLLEDKQKSFLLPAVLLCGSCSAFTTQQASRHCQLPKLTILFILGVLNARMRNCFPPTPCAGCLVQVG